MMIASSDLMLARYRSHSGSNTRAAFFPSARNDAIANVAIIIAGLVTAFVWPVVRSDLIVGIGIGAMNVDAAREVWTVAIREYSAEA
jgi:Co/Zn/Cd efflux system component